MISDSILFQPEQIIMVTDSSMSTFSLGLEDMKLAWDGTPSKELDELFPELDQKERLPGNDAEPSNVLIGWKNNKTAHSPSLP